MKLYGNIEEFRVETTKIGIENDYCEESKDFINNATTFDQLLEVGKRWFMTAFKTGWFSKELLERVPHVLRTRSQIYLNENFNTGYGLIDEGVYTISGDAQVIVKGDATITLCDNAKAHVFGSEKCRITAKDRSKVISNGDETVVATNFVFVKRNGNAEVIMNDSSVLYSNKKGKYTLLGLSIFKLAKK